MVQARKSESEVSTFPVRRRGAQPRPCFKSLPSPLLAARSPAAGDGRTASSTGWMAALTMAGGRASRAPHGRRRGEQRAALSTVVGRSRPPEEPWRAEAAQKGRKGRTPVEAGRERCEGRRWVSRSVSRVSARARPTRRRQSASLCPRVRSSVCLSVDRYNNGQEPIVCPPDKNRAKKRRRERGNGERQCNGGGQECHLEEGLALL